MVKTATILLLSTLACFGQAFTFSDVGFMQPPASSQNWSNVLLDYFTTTANPPLAVERLAEPGPGSWTNIEVTGQFSITNEPYEGLTNLVTGGAQLKWFSTNSADLTFRIITTNAIPTDSGLCFVSKVRVLTTQGNVYSGFEKSAIAGEINGAAIRLSTTDILYINSANNGFALNALAFSRNADYELAMVKRPKGAFFFIRGGEYSEINPYSKGFPDWTLLWVDSQWVDATCYPAIGVQICTNGYVDSVRVMQLGPEWNDPYYLATASLQTSTNGTPLASSVDSFITHYITAQTGVDQELRFRQIDPSNYWSLWMYQADGKSALTRYTNSVIAFSTTNTQAFTSGTSYRVAVMSYLTSINAFINEGSRGLTLVAPLLTNTVTTWASHAGSNFASWPVTPRSLTLGSCGPTRQILGYGDSRTWGGYDDFPVPPTGALPGYQRALQDGLNTNNTLNFMVGRSGKSGMTVSNLALNVVTSAVMYPFPDKVESVLVDIGANDCATTVNEAYSNNCSTVYDTLHANYSNAVIYVMQIYVKSCASLSNVRNCQKTLVAARSPWCVLGPDENVFLENGDGGATYMYDDAHPTHAGYLLIAQKWREALGL